MVTPKAPCLLGRELGLGQRAQGHERLKRGYLDEVDDIEGLTQ